MQDTKLFETILGITTPWHVARVELKTEDKRVSGEFAVSWNKRAADRLRHAALGV